MEEQDDDEFVMGKYRHNNLNKTWASVTGFETWAAMEPKWAAKVRKFRARFETEIEVISEAAGLETNRMIETKLMGFVDHGCRGAEAWGVGSYGAVDVAKARALHHAAIIFNIEAREWSAKTAVALHLAEEKAANNVAEAEAKDAFYRARYKIRCAEEKKDYTLSGEIEAEFKALVDFTAKEAFWLRQVAKAMTDTAEAEAVWIQAKKKKEKK